MFQLFRLPLCTCSFCKMRCDARSFLVDNFPITKTRSLLSFAKSRIHSQDYRSTEYFFIILIGEQRISLRRYTIILDYAYTSNAAQILALRRHFRREGERDGNNESTLLQSAFRQPLDACAREQAGRKEKDGRTLRQKIKEKNETQCGASFNRDWIRPLLAPPQALFYRIPQL